MIAAILWLVLIAANLYYHSKKSSTRLFYLAGAYTQKDALNARIEALEDEGYQCTWNWTRAEDHATDHDTMGYWAAKDIDGVKTADFVVVVMDDPGYAYRGTFTEIGAALGLGKPIYIYSPCKPNDLYARTNCFYCHPSVRHFSSWTDLIDALE